MCLGQRTFITLFALAAMGSTGGTTVAMQANNYSESTGWFAFTLLMFAAFMVFTWLDIPSDDED